MADEKKRIYELSDEALTLASDDYIAVDSSANGTRKYKPIRIEGQIGDLSTLDTTAKGSLVAAVNELKGDLAQLGSGVPTSVRQAMLTLFESAAYTTTGLEDEIAAVESWAAAVTSLTLNNSTITINGAGTSQLVATTVPSGQAVTWESSDTFVATVSNSGLVTGAGNGTATITASCGDLTATCTVTVSGFSTLESISAVYTQSGAVYTTDTLDSLKTDLVVTATYSDTSTETVPSTDYTLSGTLAVGTSTIVVSYGGKTDSFNVTVTEYIPSGYTAYDYVTPSVTLGSHIESYAIYTGAQLSTEYIINAKIYFPNETVSVTSGQGLFGTRTAQNGTKEIGLFMNYGASKFGYWYNGTDSTNKDLPFVKGAVNDIKIQPVGISESYPTNATININGVDYDLQAQGTNVTFSPWFGIYSYAIGSNTMNSNSVYYAGQQIGEITVTDLNDNIIYDFIPVKDSDDRYGYYERINGNFYYNSSHATDYTGGYWV